MSVRTNTKKMACSLTLTVLMALTSSAVLANESTGLKNVTNFSSQVSPNLLAYSDETDNSLFPPAPSKAGPQSAPTSDLPSQPAPVDRRDDRYLPSRDENQPTVNTGRAPLWPSVAIKQNQANSNSNWQGNASTENTSLTRQYNQQVEQLQKQVEMLQRRLDTLEFEQLKTRIDARKDQSQQIDTAPIFTLDDDTSSQGIAVGAENTLSLDKIAQNFSALETLTADETYNLGQQLLVRQNYQKAVIVWQSFVERFKDDQRAANASYLLGNAYFEQGFYGKAAEAYLNVRLIDDNAKLLPVSLLNLAKSMANLGDKYSACAVLEQLTKQNANTSNVEDGITEKVINVRKSLQCL